VHFVAVGCSHCSEPVAAHDTVFFTVFFTFFFTVFFLSHKRRADGCVDAAFR